MRTDKQLKEIVVTHLHGVGVSFEPPVPPTKTCPYREELAAAEADLRAFQNAAEEEKRAQHKLSSATHRKLIATLEDDIAEYDRLLALLEQFAKEPKHAAYQDEYRAARGLFLRRQGKQMVLLERFSRYLSFEYWCVSHLDSLKDIVDDARRSAQRASTPEETHDRYIHRKGLFEALSSWLTEEQK